MGEIQPGNVACQPNSEKRLHLGLTVVLFPYAHRFHSPTRARERTFSTALPKAMQARS